MTTTKPHTPRIVAALLSMTLFLGLSCKNQEHGNESLGEVHLNVSGDKNALSHFKRGLLFLHSFEYDDARTAFQEAQKADPKMAMAYWGEAMTYNHTIWGEQDYEEARTALKNLDSIAGDANITPLEEDFLEAVHILYRPETPKAQRDQEYKDFMHDLYEDYPDNQEVAAFYALSLLGSVPEGRDDKIYGQAAKVAQKVIDENPKHPGALHYLIHSYDDPSHAVLAVDAANSYSNVAPAASHALHMPSHIYVALGRWDDVVRSNEESYQASVERMKSMGLDNNARGYHAFHWLMYGYLQQGRVDTARKLLMDMERYTRETPSKRARVHLVLLKGTYMVETNTWDGPAADITVDVSDLNVSVAARHKFIEGMKAFKNKNRDTLEAAIDYIDKNCGRADLLLPQNDFKVCLSTTRSEASKTDIDEARVMETQLRGLLAWMDGNTAETEKWLKKSIEMEEALSYSFGPPFIVKPTHELYAEWLVANGRNAEAFQQYELALKRGPNRTMAVKGMEEAGNGQLSASK